MPESISLTDAAARLRRSYSQVLRLVLKGALRGWKEADHWRVNATDVERLAREARPEARDDEQ